ncbi:MAG: nucleotidyltransferase family protein [Bacteroidota bacterium]
MITKEIIKSLLLKEFPKLEADFKVKRIGLFGSYSTNQANEESDIDLIIEFNEPIGLKFINLCDYLEQLFDKKVDVLTPEGLKSIRVKSVIDNIINTVEYVEAA